MNTSGQISSIIQNPFDTRPVFEIQKAIPRTRAIQEILISIRRQQYVVVMAPRQIGKTTFLNLLRDRLENGVYIDFESSDFHSLQDITNEISRKIGIKLGASHQINLIEYLRKSADERGLVFLMDEICPSNELADEFFRSIRAYYMESFPNRSKKNMHHFVIAGSANLADLILQGDRLMSPFNIGNRVYLLDFISSEVTEFIKKTGTDKFSTEAIKLIFECTQGHPFLVQFVCQYLYGLSEKDIQEYLINFSTLIEDSRLDDAALVQSMFYNICDRPNCNPKLSTTLRDILNGEKISFVRTSPIVRNLYLEGCIRDENGICAIRNPIYNYILNKHFSINNTIAIPCPSSSKVYITINSLEYFHVFLSHNSQDKPVVRELSDAFKKLGLRVWLDEEQLRPGQSWQNKLETIIETTGAVAILVGKDGLGPWQDKETQACLNEFVDRKLPVIPVLLPGASTAKSELPLFLRNLTWVDLHNGITDEGINRLKWGIAGDNSKQFLKTEFIMQVQFAPHSSEQDSVEINIDTSLDLSESKFIIIPIGNNLQINPPQQQFRLQLDHASSKIIFRIGTNLSGQTVSLNLLVLQDGRQVAILRNHIPFP